MSAAATVPAARPTTRPTDRTDRRPVVPRATRTARYALANTLVTLRDGGFLFFTIALPVAMFLMFNLIFGKEEHGNAGVGIMTNMAAYGSFGGALNAGAIIQIERTNGWLRQLKVAGLSPRGFVIGKIVGGMAVILPALLAVFAVAMTIGGVDISLARAVRGVLVLWVSLLPMIIMGLVLGLLLPARAVQGASTITLMVLSLAGGLWFPFEMFPSWLQTVARFTPTWGVGQLGGWATLGGAFPMRPALVVVAWAIGLAVIAAVSFRRAARSSHRG